MYCSEKGVLTVVHVLLDWGAEVDDRWQVQRTVNLRSDFMAFSNDLPLFAAAMNGHGKILNLLLEKTTIDIGPRIDEDYATPLDFALKEGCEGLEQILAVTHCSRERLSQIGDEGLLRRSDIVVNVKDDAGRTPLALAQSKIHDSGKIDDGESENDLENLKAIAQLLESSGGL
ncbi:hypothetical protein FPQ18DRAFT_302997 [Pyronema domesticum]|nr:hypothetical protein FPQ18DRAFT_302997 [Pyronema domesticum]